MKLEVSNLSFSYGDKVYSFLCIERMFLFAARFERSRKDDSDEVSAGNISGLWRMYHN